MPMSSGIERPMWRVESSNNFWYCTRSAFRVRDSFLCRDKTHAQACADALNLLETA